MATAVDMESITAIAVVVMVVMANHIGTAAALDITVQDFPKKPGLQLFFGV